MYSLPHMGKQYHFGIQKGEVKAGEKKDLKFSKTTTKFLLL